MKVAVLITGIFNYNEQYLDKISQCYDLFDEQTDIFVMNNNSDEDNDLLKKYFGDKIKYINTQRNLNPDEFNLLQNKQDANVLKNKQIFFKNIHENIIPKSKVRYSHVSFFHYYNIKDIPKNKSMHQFYQAYVGLNNILDYESMNNFKYDYIMKIRLDVYIDNKRFGPIHYFNDMNDVLFKDYDLLKKINSMIKTEDDYHHDFYRINNFCEFRTTKYLGGQYVLNKNSYDQIKLFLNDRSKFNEMITKKFFIVLNDFAYFSSRDNFIEIIPKIIKNYDGFYDENVKFLWVAPETQLILAILQNNLYYLDYVSIDVIYKNCKVYREHIYGIENKII